MNLRLASFFTFAVCALFCFHDVGLMAQVAFENVSVISFDPNEITSGQTVIVVDGTISQIGATVEVKPEDGTQIIDGTGKFLMPGMMDSHAHLPGPQGLDMEMKDYLLLQLAHGVTSLRVSRYEPEFFELRKSVEKDKWLAPRLLLPAPDIRRTSEPIANPNETFKEYKAKGYDHIKYLSGSTTIQYDAYLLAAHKAGIPFFGHLSPELDLDRVIELRPDGVEHLNGFSALLAAGKVDELKTQIKKSAAQKIFHCPTVSWYNGFTLNYEDPEKEFNSRPGLEYLPKKLLQSWKEWYEVRKGETIEHDSKGREKIMEMLVDSGLPMLLSPGDGYYFVPGLAMHTEMKAFSKAGFSNHEILKAATYNGADFYDQTDVFGNVKKGLRSDLVLLGGNPVEDLKNVHEVEGVMLGSRWFGKDEIQKALNGMLESRK